MRTHVFREYLRENKKVRETVFACSYGAQVESFKQKNGQKSRDTVPLSLEGVDAEFDYSVLSVTRLTEFIIGCRYLTPRSRLSFAPD